MANAIKKIKIKIDGRNLEVLPGKTIMTVAGENNIFIPSLCFHPDLDVKANCRVCVVEVSGHDKLMTACSTKVAAGMEIFTDSPLVVKARNLNIEMIFAEHIEKCPTCSYRFKCTLLDLARRYKLKINRFPERKTARVTYKFANAVEIDGSQCIDCRNCVEACSKIQKINFLECKGQGINREIVPVSDKDIDCIYCGQCALHCPVNAAAEQENFTDLEKVLAANKKIVVVQFAPSVRATIGEEFGMKYDENIVLRLATALKQLGFAYIFDVNFGADLTTMVEAGELIERLNNKKAKLPMITSCCPAWVKYVEFFHPELIPNLTTSRSPQIHLGGAIKTYWAKQKKIDPRNIYVVSIMPCTAKKFESARDEFKIAGLRPVDLVLTTRELAFVLKKNRINLADVKPEANNLEFNAGSGAAVIYGSSGGVMESALRTANNILCGDGKSKICDSRLEFKEVRGASEIKELELDIAGKHLRVAVVNGIGAIDKILPHIKDYDYIEVMACPGGCIGGGGQPIPTTAAIRKTRAESLYATDKNKKIRKAQNNVEVLAVLKWLEEKKLSHQVLHTTYTKRIKSKK
ncbi:MAG: [FeFe] hydrogenase, group A [Candidatus Falkowbacteria bacterium]